MLPAPGSNALPMSRKRKPPDISTGLKPKGATRKAAPFSLSIPACIIVIHNTCAVSHLQGIFKPAMKVICHAPRLPP